MITGITDTDNEKILNWKCGCCNKSLGGYNYDTKHDDIEGWVYCPYCGEKLEKEQVIPNEYYEELAESEAEYNKKSLQFNELYDEDNEKDIE